jgi:hypothetical protein
MTHLCAIFLATDPLEDLNHSWSVVWIECKVEDGVEDTGHIDQAVQDNVCFKGPGCIGCTPQAVALEPQAGNISGLVKKRLKIELTCVFSDKFKKC